MGLQQSKQEHGQETTSATKTLKNKVKPSDSSELCLQEISAREDFSGYNTNDISDLALAVETKTNVTNTLPEKKSLWDWFCLMWCCDSCNPLVTGCYGCPDYSCSSESDCSWNDCVKLLRCICCGTMICMLGGGFCADCSEALGHGLN